METTQQLALITGASSGIGLALAREFARHGHPLILTAPVAEELHEIAAELEREHRVPVRVIAKNLERPEAPRELVAGLGSDAARVEILVNNAGRGRRGRFWEIPLEDDIGMMRLNVEAVLRLTKQFLPMMLNRGRGRILNTASIAGFEPGPQLAVYHATKAFVLSLSESLASELKDTGVTLTALCLGPVDTDFFPKADMVDTKIFQKGNVMAPVDVAQAGYEALMKGDRLVVPGVVNKAMVFGRRLMPESAQASVNESFYEDAPPEKRKRRRGDIEAKAEEKQPEHEPAHHK